MRKTILLLVSTTLALLLASGVALAYGGGGGSLNVIRCDGGKCPGTPKNDKMIGTSKRDIMYGFKGDDGLLGDRGKDALYGFDGNDWTSGGGDNDKVSGGDGIDYLTGDNGSDTLNGGNAKDYLFNGPGDDKIFGGPDGRSDELYMAWKDAGGHDLLDGGGGADHYILQEYPHRNWGHATISDSDVNPAPDQSVSSGDTLDASQAYSSQGLTITLTPGPGPEVTDNTGTNSVEWTAPGEFFRVDGGEADDTITGDDWPNVLLGHGGTNTISGGGGDDTVNSDGNGGSLSGGAGNDTVMGHRGATLRGDDGNDLIYASSDPDALAPLTTNVEGGAGDDDIHALNGAPDIINCGDGTDTATFDPGIDTATNCEG